MLRAFFLGESFANSVNLKVALVGPDYTFNPSHTSTADLTDVVGTPVAIPDVTISAASVVDAPDMIPAFTGLTPGVDVAALVIYAEDSVTLEDQLIGFIDTAVNEGIPFIISLDELSIRWPSGGIFGI